MVVDPTEDRNRRSLAQKVKVEEMVFRKVCGCSSIDKVERVKYRPIAAMTDATM